MFRIDLKKTVENRTATDPKPRILIEPVLSPCRTLVDPLQGTPELNPKP